MKRLLSICCIICLTACTNDVASINGKIDFIEDNRFTMDCSDEVKRPKGDHEDIGYSCVIHITEDTAIRKQNGDELTRDQLHQHATVTVILEEFKTLDTDLDSRNLEASEIILE